jgi:hypothetical protein
MCYVYMGCRRPSSLMEGHSLSLTFGSNYTRPSELIWFIVQPITMVEWVNQILEDMLRACVMEHQSSWDKNLPWAEFSYNNNYQESLKMAPFEVLYGRRCRTLVNWITPRELYKQEMLTLRVWGWRPRILECFTNEGCEEVLDERKVTPRYIGPFPILEKCGHVAYKLDLPPSLAGVHTIFHVSQLKCLMAPWMLCCLKWHHSMWTWPTPRTQSKFWIKRVVSQGERQSCSSRFNRESYWRRRNVGKWQLTPFSPSGLPVNIMRERATIWCPC